MLPSSREDDWYQTWRRSIILSGVMIHRKVEIPGFSHGNLIRVTDRLFFHWQSQASRVMSHRKVENPDFRGASPRRSTTALNHIAPKVRRSLL
ncbi:hypothetical protein Ddc_19339 [Ditylenchus destructor]|nr:hypothetical protein Ddc_19339 [Ditylenchus destructor]